MILLTLIHFNILSLATFGLADLKVTQCQVVSKHNISNLCKNPACLHDSSVRDFCDNAYENMFKCQSKIIPFQLICDGREHCQDGSDENPALCTYIACERNKYKCQNKCIDFSKLCNGNFDCGDKSDELPLVCRRLINPPNVSCPIIFQDSHNVTCHLRYGYISSEIPCDQFLPPETEVRVICKSIIEDKKLSSQRLICQQNGTWDQDIIKCELDCGKADTVAMTPLIINGSIIKINSWPWYAALFLLMDSKWQFFCGSTIISSNKVITAGHCIWDLPKEEIKVAAGKTYSDFFAEEASAQIFEVANIFKHPLYQDALGNYGSDIAIIEIKGSFSFNQYVLPICLNWTLRNIATDMKTSLEGMVAGLGITETGKVAPELRIRKVRIIPNLDCVNFQKSEFRKFISISSFCGQGGSDGTVCNGDSGGGLAIKNEETGRWFLEGIVSISQKNSDDVICDKQNYAIYTNVGLYSNWIREHVLTV